MAGSSNRPTDVKEMEFSAGESVAFDLDAFEDNVRAHGPRFIHYRAIPDPIGLISKDDSRRPDYTPNANVSNGYYYIKAGLFHALISGNTREVKATTGGVVDPSIAQLTPSCFYECELNGDSDRVYIAPLDRLYLDDDNILVTHTDLQETSLQGVDTLKFPVVKVQDLVDAEGSTYGYQDFDVLDGKICWKQGRKRPGYNIEAGRGMVYSIRFLYKPYWYIHRMVHEIRVVQQAQTDGSLTMLQAPQSAIVAREFVHRDQIADMRQKPTDRTAEQPAQ